MHLLWIAKHSKVKERILYNSWSQREETAIFLHQEWKWEERARNLFITFQCTTVSILSLFCPPITPTADYLLLFLWSTRDLMNGIFPPLSRTEEQRVRVPVGWWFERTESENCFNSVCNLFLLLFSRFIGWSTYSQERAGQCGRSSGDGIIFEILSLRFRILHIFQSCLCPSVT